MKEVHWISKKGIPSRSAPSPIQTTTWSSYQSRENSYNEASRNLFFFRSRESWSIPPILPLGRGGRSTEWQLCSPFYLIHAKGVRCPGYSPTPVIPSGVRITKKWYDLWYVGEDEKYALKAYYLSISLSLKVIPWKWFSSCLKATCPRIRS